MNTHFKYWAVIVLAGLLAACSGGGSGGSSTGSSSSGGTTSSTSSSGGISSSSSSGSSSSGGDSSSSSSSSSGGAGSSSSSSGGAGASSSSSGGLPPLASQIDILNTPLPIIEQFNVTGPNGAIAFFDPAYRALATPAVNEILDGEDNPFMLEDFLPSFYYPTCCFFQTFPSDPLDPDYDPDNVGQQRRPPLEAPAVHTADLDFRLKVADGKIAISNARFSIGQILSDLTPESAVDRKINTSGDVIVPFEFGSWGELDLSQPYRVSFCLADNGVNGAGTGNLEVFVDNNTGGNHAHSIHGSASMLLRTSVAGGFSQLVPGNRMVLDIPGDVRQVNNAGNQVGNLLNIVPLLVGTETSFLQLRVSSAAYIVISDLVVEYQSDRTVAQLVADLPCTTDDDFWVQPPPSGIALTPGDTQLDVSWSVYTDAIGFDVAYNTVDSLIGATIVNIADGGSTGTTLTGLVNNTNYYVFVRAKLATEDSAYSASLSAMTLAPTEPPSAPAGVMVAPLDEQVGVVWDAIPSADAYDVAYNTTGVTPDPLDPPNVADITGLTATLTGLTNGVNYHVFVRAKNVVGPGDYSAAKIVIPTAPVAAFWTGVSANLVHSAGNDADGVLTGNTSADVTFEMTGGNMATAGYKAFLAYRQITGDFKLVARFTSVTADPAFGTVNNNAYRFGLMMIENLNVPVDYASLARWADIGYFIVSTDPTFQGSAAEKLTTGSATRVRTNELLEPGNLLMISRRSGVIERAVSTDNGATFIPIRPDSGALVGDPISDTWYVGIYGTHHATSGTGTYVFEDIQIFQ